MSILPGKIFTMDNYRSLQTDSVCENGSIGTSSLSHYLKNLSQGRGNQPHYDRFRRSRY